MPKTSNQVELYVVDTDMVGENGRLKRIHADKSINKLEEAKKVVAEHGPFNVDVIPMRPIGQKPLHRAEQTKFGWQ